MKPRLFVLINGSFYYIARKIRLFCTLQLRYVPLDTFRGSAQFFPVKQGRCFLKLLNFEYSGWK